MLDKGEETRSGNKATVTFVKERQGRGPGEESKQVNFIPSALVQGLGPQHHAGKLGSMCHQIWSLKGPMGIPLGDLICGHYHLGHASGSSINSVRWMNIRVEYLVLPLVGENDGF